MISKDNIKRWLLTPEYLAPLFILISLFGIGVAYTTSNVYATSFSVAIFLASVFYLTISGRGDYHPKQTIDARVFVAICLFIISIAVLEYTLNSFTRTLLTHGLIAIAYTTLFVGAIYSRGSYSILATTIFVALIQRGMVYYTSPIYLGKDTLYHNRMAAEIVEAGSLSPIIASNYPRYYYASLYHTFAAISEINLGIPLKDAVFLTTSVSLTVISILVVYVFVSKFWKDYVGIAAAVFCAGADFLIRWAIQPQSTALGVAFFALSIYLFVSYLKTPSPRYIFILTIFLFTITITHHISMIITALSIFVYAISMAVIKYPKSHREVTVSAIAVSCLIFMGIFTQYQGPAGSGMTFLEAALSIGVSAIAGIGFGSTSSNSVVIDESVRLIGSDALTLIHVIGAASLLFLCILGILYWLSHEQLLPEYALALGTTIAVLFVVVLSGPVVGVSAILPWRWFPFIYILLLFAAIPGFISLLSTHIDPVRKSAFIISIILICALVVPYFFIMSGGAISAYDGSPFNNAHGAERYSLTEQERDTIEFIERHNGESSQILADDLAQSVLQRHYEVETSIITVDEEKSIIYESPALLLDREYLSTHHARYAIEAEGETVRVYGKVPLETINEKEENIVHDSGEDRIVLLK